MTNADVGSVECIGLMLAAKFSDNATRKKLVDLSVPRYWLRYLRLRILIPVVLTSVPDKNRTQVLDLTDQIAPLHATSS